MNGYTKYGDPAVFADHYVEKFRSHTRVAAHFCSVLATAEQLYHRGDHASALAIFDRSADSIRRLHAWIAGESFQREGEEVGRLCRDFGLVGPELISLRFSPKERIRWMETGLRACEPDGFEVQRSTLLSHLGTALIDSGQGRKALGYFRQAAEIAHRHGAVRDEAAALTGEGLAELALGGAIRAAALFKQARGIGRAAGDAEIEAGSLVNLATAWTALANPDKAAKFARKARRLFKKRGDLGGEARCYACLGEAAFALSDAGAAVKSYRLAANQFRRLGDRVQESRMLGNEGLVWSLLGDSEKALELYNLDLETARSFGDVRGEAISWNNIGNVHLNNGDAAAANRFHEHSLQVARDVGDLRLEGTLFGNLGAACYQIGNLQQAIQNYERSLECAEATGDIRSTARVSNNLGLTYGATENWDEALRYYDQAIKAAERADDPLTLNQARANKGSVVMLGLRKISEAEEIFQRCLESARSIGDARTECQVLNNLGLAAIAQSNHAMGLLRYREALDIACRLGYRLDEGLALANIAFCLEASGDPAQALPHAERAYEILGVMQHPNATQVERLLADIRSAIPNPTD